MTPPAESVQVMTVRKAELRRVMSWLGRRSYKARLARFGLARIQEIARENGKKGGRPRKPDSEVSQRTLRRRFTEERSSKR